MYSSQPPSADTPALLVHGFKHARVGGSHARVENRHYFQVEVRAQGLMHRLAGVQVMNQLFGHISSARGQFGQG